MFFFFFFFFFLFFFLFFQAKQISGHSTLRTATFSTPSQMSDPMGFYMNLAPYGMDMNPFVTLSSAETSSVPSPELKGRQSFVWSRDLPDADAYIKDKLNELGYSKKDSTLNKLFSGGVKRMIWPDTDEWKQRVKNRIATLGKVTKLGNTKYTTK